MNAERLLWDDIGVDPHEFVEPLGEGVVGQLIACDINGGVAAHAPDDIAASLQFAQGVLATGVDAAANLFI